MPWETVLFQLDSVLVTNRRFAVGQRSIPLQKISSLHVEEHTRAWFPVASTGLLAFLAGSAAITISNLGLGIMAVALLGVAVMLYRQDQPRYSIAVDTDDGHFVPLISGNRFLVSGVNKVLESQLDRARTSAASTVSSYQPVAATMWSFPGRQLTVAQTRRAAHVRAHSRKTA
jgi:hypothetical protein